MPSADEAPLDVLVRALHERGATVIEATQVVVDAKTGGLLRSLYSGPGKWPMRFSARAVPGTNDLDVTVSSALPTRVGSEPKYMRGLALVADTLREAVNATLRG